MTNTMEQSVDLALHPFGWVLLAIFIIGYYFIAMEEKYHIDKAKPALFIGTFMFVLMGVFYAISGLNFKLFEL